MKKFYLLTILCALLGISQAWGETTTTTTIANSQFNGIGGQKEFIWDGTHTKFKISSDNNMSYTGAAGTQHMTINGNGNISLLTPDAACSVTITKFKFVFGNPHMSNTDVTIDGEKKTMGWFATNFQIEKDCSISAESNISISTSQSADIYSIQLWYTVTPTVVPSVAEPASTTILVSLSDDRKNIDLTKVFTLAEGVPDDFLPLEYYNPNGGVIDGSNFYAEAAGDYTIKAHVAELENHHNESAWSGDYLITVERRNPTLTLTTNEAAVQVEKTLDLSALVVAHVGHALEYTVTSANKDKATLNGAEFSATEAGVYTVLIKSPQGDQYNETSQVVTVTVNAKPTPSFVRNFTQEEADAMLVEGTIENAFTLTNVSGDENLEITVVTKTISKIKKGDEVLSYDPESNTITALNAGTATIQFVQTETEEIGPASSEVFTFTVSKRNNTLYVKGEANYAGTICPDGVLENVVFTADNEDYENSPIGWSVFSGAEYAVFNEEANTVTANYQIGTAIWTISQPENYKYNAGAGAFSVSVAYAAEEGEIFAYESGDNGGEGWMIGTEDGKFGEKWFDIDGTPLKVYFTAYTTELGDGWFETHAYVQPRQYYNNEWKDAGSKIEGSLATSFAETGNHDRDLNSGAKAITFTSGGKGTKYVSNVKVSCTSYLNVANITIDKQADETSVLVPETEGKATLVVRYGIANGGTLKLQCNNPDFKFTNEKLAANTTVIEIGGEEHKTGVIEIPVYYTATAPGNVNAEILVYNGVYNQTATITASVSKFTPVIINAPQAADIKIGQKLSDSELFGGEASVEGTFTWADDTIEPDSVKVHTYKVIFTPTDTENYNTVEIDVEVKVTGTETAVDNTASEVKATKILRDGQVFILRDGKVYNLNGQEVR